jgi:hypothetical protein
MKKLLLILLLMAIPAMVFSDKPLSSPNTPGSHVGVESDYYGYDGRTRLIPYPVYLVTQEAIIIVCPVCKKKKLKSDVYPGICLYDSGQHIDAEGVIHLQLKGTITCNHTCSHGHKFKWVF